MSQFAPEHLRASLECACNKVNPLCSAIIEVDAPGAANPNLSRYEFQHVRRPIWPLDLDTRW